MLSDQPMGKRGALLSHPELDFRSGKQPPDSNRYRLLYFLLGNASLLAFNIIINAIDIYLTLTNRSDIGTQLNRFYNIPSAVTALILCFAKPGNLGVFLLIMLLLTCVELIVLPLFILVPMSENAIYYGTLVFAGLAGLSGASILSSSLSSSAQFSPRHAAFVSSGNGCCGVLAAVLRIVTKAAGSSAAKTSSSVYFFLAAAIILGTAIYFLFMLTRDRELSEKLRRPSEDEGLFTGGLAATFKVIWPIWVACCVNFMVTLSMFPGYLSELPHRKPWLTWTPVVITALFCVFDWVGRYIPNKFMWPSEKWAWAPVYSRLLFFVIFMISLQNVVDLGEPYWTFLWMIPFAITNGFIGTISAVYGSNHSQLNEDQKQTAGFFMGLAINVGILCAIALTYAIPAPTLT
jgi:equilibrative nucleoside transporter 1/2/3